MSDQRRRVLPVAVAAGLLFVFWVALSGKLDAFHLSLGLLTAVAVTLATHRLYRAPPQPMPAEEFGRAPLRWRHFLTYSVWLLWQISLRGLEPTARLWVSTSRLARWIGIRVEPSTTPQEHARQIDATLGLGELAVDLADHYTATRFGRKTLNEEQRAHTLQSWKRLRNSLIRRWLRIPVKPPSLAEDEIGSAPAPAGD